MAGRCFSLGCLHSVQNESATSKTSIAHLHAGAVEVMTPVFVNWYFVRESDLAVISQAGGRASSL